MALISFTAQWVDSDYNLVQATLHTQNFRELRTADRVRETLEEMLNSWGIDMSHVHVI